MEKINHILSFEYDEAKYNASQQNKQKTIEMNKKINSLFPAKNKVIILDNYSSDFARRLRNNLL